MTQSSSSNVEYVHVKASILDNIAVKAAIDNGASLTKVIFLPKNAVADENDFLKMRCVTFPKDQFKDAVFAVKEQAQLPSSGKLHVTGASCTFHKTMIEEALGLEIVFVREFTSITNGAFMLVSYNDHPEIYFPEDKRSQYASDKPFPGIVLYSGSSSVMFHVDQYGNYTSGGGSYIAGKLLLGLGKAMVGVDRYDDIMTMAENSGVTVESHKNVISLLDFISTEIALQIAREVHQSGKTNVYVVGNSCRGAALRNRIIERLHENVKDKKINLRFLRGSVVSTIGTMLSTPE